MLRHVGNGDIPPMPRQSVDFQDTFISHKGWEEACSQKVPKLLQEGKPSLLSRARSTDTNNTSLQPKLRDSCVATLSCRSTSK